METKLQKIIVQQEYNCIKCDYKCSKPFLWKQHIATAKHKRKHQETNGNGNNIHKLQCIKCNKQFINRSGLWKHNKKCNYEENDKSYNLINNENKEDYKELIIKLLIENQEFKKEMFKENQELRKQISELIPKVGNNNNSNNTNNVKQKFNINLFLNEKCKDALSMDEFIDKIEVTMKNLLTTKDKGLGQGLSNIIIDNMNKLSLYERPMHCTDKKRETLYVKNNEWEKDEKKEQISKLLNRVEQKQMKSINKWIKEHPDWKNNSIEQEEYMKLVRNCTDDIKEDKIIKRLCNNNYLNPDDAFE